MKLTKKSLKNYNYQTANDKFKRDHLNIERSSLTLRRKSPALFLDAKDLEILKALQEDSRQTYTAIGKRVGIAHSTVYDRVRRMEVQKVIKNYTALVDLEKAGVKKIMAIMTVYTDPKETERVAEKLAESPEVLEVYTSLSDELLIMAKVLAASQEGLHAFVANSVAPLRGVLRIRTAIVTRKLKETHFLVNDCLEGSRL
ncbi:MAG: Lrp/AsnC family transcriptional regulator [Candidatus Bathyarchaeia archaeon]